MMKSQPAAKVDNTVDSSKLTDETGNHTSSTKTSFTVEKVIDNAKCGINGQLDDSFSDQNTNDNSSDITTENCTNKETSVNKVTDDAIDKEISDDKTIIGNGDNTHNDVGKRESCASDEVHGTPDSGSMCAKPLEDGKEVGNSSNDKESIKNLATTESIESLAENTCKSLSDQNGSTASQSSSNTNPSPESQSAKNQLSKTEDSKRKKSRLIKKQARDTETIRPIARLLFDVAFSLSKQHVYKDLIKLQTKRELRGELDDFDTQELKKMKLEYDDLILVNEPYVNNLKTCSKCNYVTDSKNVLLLHLETAHRLDNGKLECGLCDDVYNTEQLFGRHMLEVHNRQGKIESDKKFLSCPTCPFEHSSRSAFTKHRLRCDKQFNLTTNLVPYPADCDIPLKAPEVRAPIPDRKPIYKYPTPPPPRQPTRPVHASTISRPSGMSMQVQRPSAPPQQIVSTSPSTMTASPGFYTQQITIGGQVYNLFYDNQKCVMRPVNSQGPANNANSALSQYFSQQTMIRPPVPFSGQSKGNTPPSSMATIHHPALAQSMGLRVTTPSRMPQLTAAKPSRAAAKPMESKQKRPDLVMSCDVCGVSTRDAASMRLHKLQAHKPNLSSAFKTSANSYRCNECNATFVNGMLLKHHCNTEHRTEKCPLCGFKVNDMPMHLNCAHNLTLSAMLERKKCLICQINFTQNRLLEYHLASSHGEILKALLPNKVKAKSTNDTNTNQDARGRKSNAIQCSYCNLQFENYSSLASHTANVHSFKCHRCNLVLASREIMMAHVVRSHKDEKEVCLLCDAKVPFGRPFIRHFKTTHMKNCTVKLTRLSDKTFQKYSTHLPQKTTQSSGGKRPSDVIVLDDESTPKKVARLASAPSKTPVPNQISLGAENGIEDTKQLNYTKETSKINVVEEIDVNGETVLVEHAS